MVCRYYSAVGKMEDCYSEGRGFETVWGALPSEKYLLESMLAQSEDLLSRALRVF